MESQKGGRQGPTMAGKQVWAWLTHWVSSTERSGQAESRWVWGTFGLLFQLHRQTSEQARGSCLPRVGSEGVLLSLTSLQGSCHCRSLSLVSLPRCKANGDKKMSNPEKQVPNNSENAKGAQRDRGLISSGDISEELGGQTWGASCGRSPPRGC